MLYCKKCNATIGCQTCLDGDSCETCKGNLILQEDKTCKQTCPDG